MGAISTFLQQESNRLTNWGFKMSNESISKEQLIDILDAIADAIDGARGDIVRHEIARLEREIMQKPDAASRIAEREK